MAFGLAVWLVLRCYAGYALKSLRFRGRFRFVVQHGGALRNVSFGSGLIEAARTVRTLHVVWILRWWRRGQIRQLATLGEMGLHLFGRPDGLDELFVLPTPVALAFAVSSCLGRCRRGRWAGNGLLTGRDAHFLLLEDVLFGVGPQHSVLGCVVDLTLFVFRLLTNLPMLLDPVFGEVTTADGAPR